MARRVDAEPGRIVRVAGPVVGAVGLDPVRLNDVVHVGEAGLLGEVIAISGGFATVQVYEDTSGVAVGEPVRNTGAPLVVQLGPGLLGQIYDGCQRPLMEIAGQSGSFIRRGVKASALPRSRRWAFTADADRGDRVGPGDVLGHVSETPAIEHRVMVPAGLRGRIAAIRDGEFTVEDVVALIEPEDDNNPGASGREIRMAHPWPVRRPRPVQSKLDFRESLVTGTRIIDALFPIARGGTAIIPGGFGTGKTVLEQSLARWADADIVVYVGCGERGNEMAEVLEEFPQLVDPRSGLPLMNRTVLIANTSNMPVAAREASIYTGATIAEYYRDMGYDVLLLADSTSRWAEALREISGRLEEIPGEEGYPAYLSSRLSEFYERSGRATCLGEGGRTGSLTVIGAVSPPGGDFSEPVTQSSLRAAGAFWALDYNLSRRRHFPAISWAQSYTLYGFRDGGDWDGTVRQAASILQRADELQDIVQVVGPEALADAERLLLLTARLIREDFLQQSSFEEADRFSPPEKTRGMLRAIMAFDAGARAALAAGASLDQLRGLPVVTALAEMKRHSPETAAGQLEVLAARIRAAFSELGAGDYASENSEAEADHQGIPDGIPDTGPARLR